jgi:hypothetical protein
VLACPRVVDLSMLFLPAELKATPQLNLRASRQVVVVRHKHGHEEQTTNPSTVSVSGPKRTSLFAPHMSAFGGKADMACCGNPLSRSLSGVKRT